MSGASIAIVFCGTLGQAIYSDVIGYQRARSQWLVDKRTNPIGCGEPPVWDWPLCTSRIAGGVIAGLGIIAGFGAFNPNSGGAQ